MDQNKEFSGLYPLKRNTINIFGEINDTLAERVIQEIQYLEDNGVDEITIQINSPGGSVTAGLAIYDTINYVGARIKTIGLGMVASMAAVLLSAGSRGYRCVTENCEVLIHQPLGGVSGQASDIIIAAEHINRTRERLNKILADNTDKSLEQIERDTDRDTIMTSEQALEYGLVDMVIYSKNKAKKEDSNE